MGIIKRIKRRLPIVGAGGNRGGRQAEASPARPAYNPSSWTPPEPEPEPESARGEQPAAEFIAAFVKDNPLVVFMKGSPSSPSCGFSANASAILAGYGKPIAHFDVLSDPDVRSAVKDFSNWPTIPQIYIGGEFVGGSDILQQMHEAGELKELLEEAFGAAAEPAEET